jgi:hypothetical protein
MLIQFKFGHFPILSQKVSKFELYKHNDELFNIYYGIFYELWTFAHFDRLCKLGINKQKIMFTPVGFVLVDL